MIFGNYPERDCLGVKNRFAITVTCPWDINHGVHYKGPVLQSCVTPGVGRYTAKFYTGKNGKGLGKEISEKVVLLAAEWKFFFYFFKAIFDTSFRLPQPFFGKWNCFVQMVYAIPGRHLPVVILRTICPTVYPPACPCKCSLRANSPLIFIWWAKPTARERASERQSLPALASRVTSRVTSRDFPKWRGGCSQANVDRDL